MRPLIVAITLTLLSTVTASAATCRQQANAQKLTETDALDYINRCAANARATCQQSSLERYRAAGAARDAFVERCIREAVGG